MHLFPAHYDDFGFAEVVSILIPISSVEEVVLDFLNTYASTYNTPGANNISKTSSGLDIPAYRCHSIVKYLNTLHFPSSVQ